jgi:DNA-binding SARP family transcriptional activator
VWEQRLALQKLLQILLTDRRAFPDEELAEYLWDEPGEHAKKTVRARISELRRLLESKLKDGTKSRYILRRNSGYCFCWERPDYYWIDADEFDKHSIEAQRYYAQQAWVAAVQEYEAALALYQGEYLAEERYEEWAAGPSRRYREKFLQALESVAECHARLGQYEKAIAACRRALTDTCEERFFQRLMLWHYLSGNHSEALRTYEECKRVLKERINTEPSPETVRLYEQIRARRVLDIDRPYPPPKITRPQIPYALSPGSVPFVGRRAELARLVGYLEQARQGHGCSALISGEAGWGKTRLAHELIAYAQRRFENDSFQGRCSNVAYLAYQPWAEIVRRALAADLAPVPFPKGKGTGVRSGTNLQPLWLAEVAQLVPELRTHKPDLPINPELPPQQAQLRFFEGLTQFLLSLAERKGLSKPLILFLDDLHWADTTSLDFLSYFLPRIEQRPIFLIGAYRSEEVPKEHPLQKFVQTWEPKGLAHSLALPHWAGQEVHDLLQSLPFKVADLQAFAQRLYRESEGVPLFVILTLQHLFETDLLRVEGQAWIATGSLADERELPLPRAIQELIERRVSWLSEPELELLQLTSVIGREFEYAVLQRAWEDDSLTALEGLVKAHLVVERQGRYEFSHELISKFH